MTQVAKRKPKPEDEILKEMKPAPGENRGKNGGESGENRGRPKNSIMLPMQDPDDTTYVGRHSGRVVLNLDRGEQLNNFREIYTALKLNNYKLKNGRYVDSAASAFKWMMENVCKENN